MDALILVQGSPEWKAARVGSLGASQIADMMARTKSGWGASRANLMATLIAERLTSVSTEGYTSAAMQWGTDTEPQARAAYEFLMDVNVQTVGLAKHPTLAFTHASPDGLIGDDGTLEIKCPLTAQHIETLLTGTIAEKYNLQMQWQMCCTGRKWCDYFSFDPRMPPSMQTFCKRVMRDDTLIAELEREVKVFLEELARKLMALAAKYDQAEAA